MVIFMPYHRQHGQFYHLRSRPSTSSIEPISNCKFGSIIICRFIFSLLILIVAFFILELSIGYSTNQNEGMMIIAIILLIIALISFVRTIQMLRRYDLMMKTRRRWIERQNNEMTSSNERIDGMMDLPSYKELFPSHLDLSTNGNRYHPSPPSYNDFLKTFVCHSTDRTNSSDVFSRSTVTHV